jgi:hypothetical protein
MKYFWAKVFVNDGSLVPQNEPPLAYQLVSQAGLYSVVKAFDPGPVCPAPDPDQLDLAQLDPDEPLPLRLTEAAKQRGKA